MYNPFKKLVDIGVSHQNTTLAQLRQRTVNVVNAFYIALMFLIIVVRFMNGQYMVVATNSIFFFLMLLSVFLSYQGRLGLSVALSGWVVVTQPFLLSYFKLLPAFQMLPQLVLLMGVFQIASPTRLIRYAFLVYCLFLLALVSMSEGFSFAASIPFLLQVFVIGIAVNYYVTFLESQDSSLNQAIVDLKDTNKREHQLNESLAEKNAELTMYSNIMSHDLRSPLQSIMTGAEMIEADPSDEHEVRVCSKVISSSAESMSHLIDDLLLYSNVDSDARPEFKSVDLNQIADKVVSNLLGEISSNEIQLTIADLPSVKGDATLLTALFQNLMSNAIKFQPKNVSDHESRLEISSSSSGSGEHVVLIEDNGIGIPEDSVENLFQPFQRFHASDYKGTGLGMSICKRVMQIHNGDIVLKYSSENGSCFQLTFPSSPDASRETH